MLNLQMRATQGSTVLVLARTSNVKGDTFAKPIHKGNLTVFAKIQRLVPLQKS
jgi:hypothetical protein